MSRKKLLVTIYLPPAHLAALRALSQRTRITQAEYVREGIDAAIAAERERLAEIPDSDNENDMNRRA